MSTILSSVIISIAAIFLGGVLGAYSTIPAVEKKLGTAICKKLSGSYARLDDQPVCINAGGGILKFYD